MLLKRLAPLVVLLALVGAACGKDNPSVTAGSATDHNGADVAFAQGMIPHHEQAVKMADMALAKAADPAVKKLAAGIKQAQGPEITTMTGWLDAWGEKAGASAHGADMNMMSGGMMSDQEMGELDKASGAAFDRLFLTMMTRHHQGALAMAKTELDKGRYQPAKTLATRITTSQMAEIEEMKRLLATTS